MQSVSTVSIYSVCTSFYSNALLRCREYCVYYCRRLLMLNKLHKCMWFMYINNIVLIFETNVFKVYSRENQYTLQV